VSLLGSLLDLHQRPDLPPSEARDVNRELLQTFTRGLSRSDYIPQDEVQLWLTQLMAQEEAMAKAVILNPAYVQRAYPNVDVTEAARWQGHKGILHVAELGVAGGFGLNRWADKGTPNGGFDFLSYMHENLDIHQAIVFTRTHQVGTFLRPFREDDNNPLGYRWVRKDGEKLTEDDKKATNRLDRLLAMSGTDDDPTTFAYDHQRSLLPEFTKALVANSLIADACPVEIEPVVGNPKKVAGWYALDFRTIRLAWESGYDGDDRIVGVQLAPESGGVPIVGYERDELIWAVRNPRANVFYGRYGKAELEAYVKAATAYLNSCTFNAANQDRNSLPRGFLTLYGRFDTTQLLTFKEQWNALVKGAARRWALPVLVSESRQEGGAAYTPVDTQLSEMYLTKWIIFQVSILCSFYGLDPIELNMESFTSKQSSLSGKDTAEKLQSSHDRGLITLMLWVETWFNTYLIPRLQTSPKYDLVFVGLFPSDEDRKHERQKLTLTVDEMRRNDGEDPIENPLLGNAPVNPSLMSAYMVGVQQDQAAQQQQPPGGGEDENYGLPDSDAPYFPGAANKPPALPAPGGGGQPQVPGVAPGRPALPAPGSGPPRPVPGGAGRPGAPAVGLAKARQPGRLTVTIRELPPDEARGW
jgi:hypothetical protein